MSGKCDNVRNSATYQSRVTLKPSFFLQLIFVRIFHLNLDPEPVYAQDKTVRKLKGRKAKVTSVDLDGKQQTPGENDLVEHASL